jgi:hypothetical protein
MQGPDEGRVNLFQLAVEIGQPVITIVDADAGNHIVDDIFGEVAGQGAALPAGFRQRRLTPRPYEFRGRALHHLRIEDAVDEALRVGERKTLELDREAAAAEGIGMDGALILAEDQAGAFLVLDIEKRLDFGIFAAAGSDQIGDVEIEEPRIGVVDRDVNKLAVLDIGRAIQIGDSVADLVEQWIAVIDQRTSLAFEYSR